MNVFNWSHLRIFILKIQLHIFLNCSKISFNILFFKILELKIFTISFQPWTLKVYSEDLLMLLWSKRFRIKLMLVSYRITGIVHNSECHLSSQKVINWIFIKWFTSLKNPNIENEREVTVISEWCFSVVYHLKTTPINLIVSFA